MIKWPNSHDRVMAKKKINKQREERLADLAFPCPFREAQIAHMKVWVSALEEAASSPTEILAD